MRRSFRNRSAGAPRSGSDREFAFRSSRSVLSPPRYGKRHAPYRGGFERCSSRRARAAGERARASRPRIVGPYDRASDVHELFRPHDLCAGFLRDFSCGRYVRDMRPRADVYGGGADSGWRWDPVGRRRDRLPEKVFSRSVRLPVDRPACRVCGLSRIGNIPGHVFCGGGKLLPEQTVDELLAVESLQLVDPFAHADETDGYLELVADADHDAALGRTVELRDGERGDLRPASG